MAAGAICHALLLVGIVLAAWLCGCTAADGFSVELIHRDSVRSPFHDPSLTAHGRLLAAVRRSAARASALARSYAGGSPHGVVSEVISRPYEYLMYVDVGTPPTRMLAVVDTGSQLVWLKCANVALSAAAVVFNPSSSSTFGRVPCQSDACHAAYGTSCGANSGCYYVRSYVDGSQTSGLLSTETFTFGDAPGGRPQLLVPRVNFGCSTATTGKLLADGLVGLGRGDLSLVTQLGAGTSLGRRFSYCLVPYSINASSALNFGARAAVTEPGAATTALIASDRHEYYTVVLESVKIGSATLQHVSNIIIDSGTTLTYLDKALLDPIVEEMARRINVPRKQSPEKLLQLCYDVAGGNRKYLFLHELVPDVTLMLAVFGQAVTLKPENTFVEVQEGTMCLVMAPVTEQQPLAIIGNIAQQNFHVGYDIDKGTITFAPADCTSSYR